MGRHRRRDDCRRLVTAGAAAQDSHKGHQGGQPPPAAGKDAATKTPAQGGEAYLTDGGPRDTRIRFYRDIALMRGHILVGGQLIELGLWDEALPHFLHPTEELYGAMEKYIKMHGIRPFSRELQALAQAVKAKRKGAYEQALKVVDQRLEGALAVARKFMTPLLGFTAKSAAEVLKVALSEYEGRHRGRPLRQAGRIPGQPRLRLAGRAHDRGRCRRACQGRRRGAGQDPPRARRAQDRLAGADAAAERRSWSPARCRR